MKRLHGHYSEASAFAMVYDLVRGIPPGKVMTYGQISGLLGHLLSPAAVGWALHVCPEDVPWHRVVNAQGRCSTERLPDFPPGLQRRLLEAEGIRFTEDGRLDLQKYRSWGLEREGK
ncbi:MAG: MGMT family protein [Thermoanaerobaculaceae bacterium]